MTDPKQANGPPPAAAPQPSPAEQPLPKIALVVDDEPANRDFLVRLLEQASLDVRSASSGAEARRIMDEVEHMVLCAVDHHLPDADGVELLGQLRTRYPDARLVMATMLDERALMERAFANGCDVFLVKPHGFMELFKRLQDRDASPDQLDQLVIDQYGPRPFRG